MMDKVCLVGECAGTRCYTGRTWVENAQSFLRLPVCNLRSEPLCPYPSDEASYSCCAMLEAPITGCPLVLEISTSVLACLAVIPARKTPSYRNSSGRHDVATSRQLPHAVLSAFVLLRLLPCCVFPFSQLTWLWYDGKLDRCLLFVLRR
ncbi:hypothetical protein FVEG_15496 [Fusarium verticillioides 7600]|uniref:Uncharacterized protein n=1 Tax=Gibberella moniliformis (strain M3125 / FGSC 7600) TaxID=334819 RepID=W7LW67_GIBM7|nr:hypothetical protein FVEG_15496 [Fusarium verticillioides 7600]EWG42816.1 hypothetical protein FVEG_15496 [Fusarium verticillioides 7600]